MAAAIPAKIWGDPRADAKLAHNMIDHVYHDVRFRFREVEKSEPHMLVPLRKPSVNFDVPAPPLQKPSKPPWMPRKQRPISGFTSR
eukprot:SAG11_NODE_16694_length_540_cov_1.056689_1_plen_85_part_10